MYRSAGKQRTVHIGEYPPVRLRDARLKVADCKMSRRAGLDPKEPINAGSSEETVNKPTWRQVATDYVVQPHRNVLDRRQSANATEQAKHCMGGAAIVLDPSEWPIGAHQKVD